jgi:hypothetical protein
MTPSTRPEAPTIPMDSPNNKLASIATVRGCESIMTCSMKKKNPQMTLLLFWSKKYEMHWRNELCLFAAKKKKTISYFWKMKYFLILEQCSSLGIQFNKNILSDQNCKNSCKLKYETKRD